MTLYAETSAVLAWLFGETRGPVALAALRKSDRVFASELTLIESHRAIHSAVATGRLRRVHGDEAREQLESETVSWIVHDFDAEITRRARHGFPREPVRALDALHLATAMEIRAFRPELNLLSFDRRVRENAAALGFEVVPDTV